MPPCTSPVLLCLFWLLGFFFLRQNSQTIKITILKHGFRYIQWFLVYSQGRTTITSISLQNVFINPKRTPLPMNNDPPSLHSPSPGGHESAFCRMDFPILDVSHTCNCPVRVLPRLESFTRRSVSQVLPCWRRVGACFFLHHVRFWSELCEATALPAGQAGSSIIIPGP